MDKKTVMLMILDGMGIGEDYPGNAVEIAKTPNLDRLLEEYPNTQIGASGVDVGLPAGQMGNSEVGHLNLGSGRIMFQDLLKIGNAIEDESIYENRELKRAIQNSLDSKTALHFIGLLSDGGVHSHEKHLYALLKMAKMMGQDRVYVHAILDGRDVDPHSGVDSIKGLEEVMMELGVGEIASISGRYYAMDRDKHWDRVELAYDAMVSGVGPTGTNPIEVVGNSYAADISDEFVIPTVITKNGEAIGTINSGDSIIFYNFRPDRMRQIVRSIVQSDFDGFARKKVVDTYNVSMTEYDGTIENIKVAYTDGIPENTLGEYLSTIGKTQLRIAETEKYAHVTFFFNGGEEVPYPGEDRILVQSPQVATFDLQPEMSAMEIAEKVNVEILAKKYDLIVLNFANCDMVGHSGMIPPAVKAVETVDTAMGLVLETLKSVNGSALITADHGNVEKMLNELGNPVTSHTSNPVPLILYNYEGRELSEGGKLSDIAPTLLEMMNLDKPSEMTGHSLLK